MQPAHPQQACGEQRNMMDTELRVFVYLFFSSAFFVLFRDGGQTCRPAPHAAAAKEVTLRRVWEALNAVEWARKVLRRLWTKYCACVRYGCEV